MAAGVAALAWLANSVISQVEALTLTRNLSPFHWFLGGEPLKHGLQVGNSLTLLAVAVVLVAAGTWAFSRRDVAV